MIRHLPPRFWVFVSGAGMAVHLGAALGNLFTGNPWEALGCLASGLPFWFLMNVSRDAGDYRHELEEVAHDLETVLRRENS